MTNQYNITMHNSCFESSIVLILFIIGLNYIIRLVYKTKINFIIGPKIKGFPTNKVWIEAIRKFSIKYLGVVTISTIVFYGVCRLFLKCKDCIIISLIFYCLLFAIKPVLLNILTKILFDKSGKLKLK